MLFTKSSKLITPNNVCYNSQQNQKVLSSTSLQSNESADFLFPQPQNVKSLSEFKGENKSSSSTTTISPLNDVTINEQNIQYSETTTNSITDSDLIWGDENFCSTKTTSKKRERQIGSGTSSRRRTLSPTSSKYILQESLDDENDNVVDSNQIVISQQNDLFMNENPNETIVDSLVENIEEEIPTPNATIPIPIPIVTTIETNQIPQQDENLLIYKDDDNDDDNVCSTNMEFDETCFVSNSLISSVVNNIPQPIERTQKIKSLSLSSLSTSDSKFHSEALRRYHIRQEIARWKYSWEIISHEAAEIGSKYCSND